MEVKMTSRTGGQKTIRTVVDGVRMNVRVSDGTAAGGPPVVLVHGLVVSGRYMVPTLERLAPFYPVYAPDLPGFGGSGKPARALDIGGLSDALAGWMREVGLGSAALVANSVGCQVIAELALCHPGLVERVVLQGPTIDPRGRNAPRQIGRLLLDTPREPPSLLAIEGLDLLRAGVGRSWRTFRYALEDPITEKLAGVRVPALVVRGSRDPISPQRWAEEVARLLPHGRLVVIPRAAHAANYSAPGGFVHAIRPFLDGG